MKKQYIPQATQDKKVAEFHNLVQGEMTIVQYENKFLGLSRYASHMEADEEEKAKKIQSGLAPYIYEKIVHFKSRTTSRLSRRP